MPSPADGASAEPEPQTRNLDAVKFAVFWFGIPMLVIVAAIVMKVGCGGGV